MNWGEIQWFLIALAVVLGAVEFLRKRKARQAERERSESTPPEYGAEPPAKSSLEKFSDFIFSWRGYVLLGVVAALSYAIEQREYTWVLLIVLAALLALGVTLMRMRNKLERVPDDWDG